QPVPTHKSVDPEEIQAARFADETPSLVTIQAGANDIDFVGCMGGLLGAPKNPWVHVESCVTQDAGGYHLTAKVSSELASLTTGLEDTVDAIRANAPNAQIVLVDYYQLIPAPSTPKLYGGGLIC